MTQGNIFDEIVYLAARKAQQKHTYDVASELSRLKKEFDQMFDEAIATYSAELQRNELKMKDLTIAVQFHQFGCILQDYILEHPGTEIANIKMVEFINWFADKATIELDGGTKICQ